MKHLYISTCLLFFITIGLKAQTIWSGPTTTFTKAGFADWTLEANQDRITPNVWITRANTQGIFNIFTESNYSFNLSPSDTEWAFGTTADYLSLTYDDWETTNGSNPPGTVGQDMVVHLITDDIYIDIKFTAWGQGAAAGGSFSYERSTDQALSTNDFEANGSLKLFPNPASQSVQISGLTKEENYTIHNVLGLTVNKGSIANNQRIDIKNLSIGMYFLKFENGYAVKFIKE